MRLGIVEETITARVSTVLGIGVVQELDLPAGVLTPSRDFPHVGPKLVKVRNLSFLEVPKGRLVAYDEVDDCDVLITAYS